MCRVAVSRERVSLLNFLTGTNTVPSVLDEMPPYFVLDFLRTKASLTIKGEESRTSATRPPSWKFRVNSGNLSIN